MARRALGDQFRFALLPVVTLTLVQLGGYTRFMRGAMIEALRQDYVRTAAPRARRSAACCGATPSPMRWRRC